ncbi:hypothetical protein B0T20DRAFT_351810 [Sordaria brevicollis]|uniref:Uncharacterized protein n=1 Tax=Sordaria brevicollis TaxID=83679 RepID=A0AAE0PGF1_SORBR|nr:hypothetical protein B0T20DRAFT_351810 [Sordaria brevicollis]
MLVRDLRRLCLIVGPILVFFFITLTIWGLPSSFASTGEKVTSLLGNTFNSDNKVPYHGGSSSSSSSSSKDGTTTTTTSSPPANGGILPGLFQSSSDDTRKEGTETHQNIKSVSTKSGSYFPIEFAPNVPAFNPNIIPHPTREGVFIVVAQKWHKPLTKSSSSRSASSSHNTTGSEKEQRWKSQHVTMQSELHCLASFSPSESHPSVLRCLPDHPPLPLPIAATPGNNCVGPLLGFTCFGMWMQDFRVLVEWWGAEVEAFGASEGWRVAGELQRPALPASSMSEGEKDEKMGGGEKEGGDLKGKGEGKADERELSQKDDHGEEKAHIAPGWGEIEKNWFVFWAPPLPSPSPSISDAGSSPKSSHHKPESKSLQTYIHYDFFPHRSFALLHDDGSATPLPSSPTSVEHDTQCLTHYLPSLPTASSVSIHQSTNSLLLTLCNRSDPSCVPSATNTFLLSIIQYKTFEYFHSEYEPYVVLFSQQAPGFEVFAVSKKPVWIEGRKKWAEGEWHAGEDGLGDGKPRTEMFYVTSVNWRDYRSPVSSRGQRNEGEGDDDEEGERGRGEGKGYHGYLDDVLVIGFGIEDKESGGIDVLAGELVRGMGLCEDVVVVDVGKQTEVVGHGVANDAVPDLGLGPGTQEIPADLPADFPKDFPAAAPGPAQAQADFGLGPGVQMDAPPPPEPHTGSLLAKRRLRRMNGI